MGNQLTVPSGSSWYLDDFNSNHLKDAKSIFDGTLNLSFRALENKEPVAVKAVQLSGKDSRSIAQTFYSIYDEKSKILSKIKSGNLMSTPILTKNAAYLKRPFIDMPITERIVIDPPLEEFEKKWIAFQLLHAIRNLHQITIFHGDIKPENVLVDPNLTIYLTDHAPFKPQYISQNQPHYFIHFFSYGRPSAYIAPERISKDLSTNMELQKEQTNRAILAIQAITESLQQAPQTNNRHENESGQISTENSENQSKFIGSQTSQESIEALQFMQAADLFSIGCVLAFIFTGGKSLFDFTSLIQYGMSNDDSPLKILDSITDDSMKQLILKLIDRDQKKRVEAINGFERSFPAWMNELYRFYIDHMIDSPLTDLPMLLSSNKVKQIFPDDTHDEVLIYLNIISDFFSKQMGISCLSFLIRHFEQFSLRVSSPRLKVVRLIPPLLFLLQRESATVSTYALDSILVIVQTIETIENEEEIVKNFCDYFFIPQLISVMVPKKKAKEETNEKIIIISRIPVILAEFGRLWPSILDKIPMRTEFIIPMLQYGGNAPVDEAKLMIVRYFLASARCVTCTKSYPLFRALYRILFQMLNCPVYVPLIVDFVQSFLRELNHVDKIRFYSELFAPFQGAVLSYASNFTKSDKAEDILIIFEAFATMIERGEIRTSSFTAVANAAYKHVTSFSPSSRVAARVLLKKLPAIYQLFEILPIVSPQPSPPQPSQQPQQQLFAPISMSKSQNRTLTAKSQSSNLATPKNLKQNRNTISLSSSQKKKAKKGGGSVPLIEDANSSSAISSSEFVHSVDASETADIQASSSSENLSSLAMNTNNPIQSPMNSSSQLSLDSEINNSNLQSSSSQRQLNEPTIKTRNQNFQSQIKTHLISSTKIASSPIQKILVARDDYEDTIQSIVLHSKNTVVCYTVNAASHGSSSSKSSISAFDGNKIIEQSWVYTYPMPVLSIDIYKNKSGSTDDTGLIISFPDSIVKRTRGKTVKILESRKPLRLCKMVSGTTIALSENDTVFCRDISHNFELKGTYKVQKDESVTTIYSWDTMNDDFFAVTTSNGRLHAIDQRTNVPIFSTVEYSDMTDVALLPHLAYAIVRGGKELFLYKYNPLFQSEEKFSDKTVIGGYSSMPTYEIKGSVDSMMSISNSLIVLNQYGTFMLANNGDCFSLNDRNRAIKLNKRSNFLNRQMNGNANSPVLTDFSQSTNVNISRHRSTSVYDVNKNSFGMNSAVKSDINFTQKMNFATPVVTLPNINYSTLHGHTFPVSACANYNDGEICMSGDSAGYLNIWSAMHQ